MIVVTREMVSAQRTELWLFRQWTFARQRGPPGRNWTGNPSGKYDRKKNDVPKFNSFLSYFAGYDENSTGVQCDRSCFERFRFAIIYLRKAYHCIRWEFKFLSINDTKTDEMHTSQITRRSVFTENRFNVTNQVIVIFFSMHVKRKKKEKKSLRLNQNTFCSHFNEFKFRPERQFYWFKIFFFLCRYRCTRF